MAPPPNVSATQIQIDNLADRMDAGFTEIKDMLRSYEERTRKIEQHEAGCQPIVIARIDAHDRELQEHNTRLTTKSQQINKLEQQVSKMADMYRNIYRFAWFVGSAFILSVSAFLWALITHQAMVVIK